MPIGAIDPNGVLTLNGDPRPWIENNRNSCLQVRSLDLYFHDNKDAEKIGDSIGELTELTRLDISGYLEYLPSAITRLHKLESLEIKFRELKELPENLGQLVNLRQLCLRECRDIKSLPNSIATLHNLTSLSLFECDSLKELPSNLVSLTQLSVSWCHNIKSLPNTLPNLTSLSLHHFVSLEELPSNLVSLTQLSVSWCDNIKSLPNTLPNLTSLSLFLCDSLEELPSNLVSLTQLSVSWCHNIKSLPNTLPNLTSLSLDHCVSLKELPSNLVSLTQLSVSWCDNIESLPNTLPNLTSLSLDLCDSLEELPSNLDQLVSLKVSYCKNIKSLPNTLLNLTSLSLNYCRSLKELPSNLVSLTQLSLLGCDYIESLPNTLPNLTSLSLNYCRSLKELPSNLVSLTQLSLLGCDYIESLPNTLPNLTSLSLNYCRSLKELPSNLVSLTQLSLLGCDYIESLPNTLPNLTSLSLDHCVFLKELPSNLDQLVSLKVSDCKNIKSLPNTLLNLKSLSLTGKDITELPLNLDGLAQLCLLDIRYALIKCLPWSIAKIRNLQHLMLPRDFRLQTLPSHLKDSVVISVYGIHVRKSWKEVKEEMGPSSFPVDREEMASLHPSNIWPPGYLRLYRLGNLHHWISNNYNSHMLVQFLELESYRTEKDIIEINMAQLNELTHLYISGDKPLPHNYFATLTRLRYLSLECYSFGCLCGNFHVDSLSKLSNLETLHLACHHQIGELVDISLPTSLKFLSLRYGNIKTLHDSLEKLTNLKTMYLGPSSNLELLPANLNFAKVRLTACDINTLPTGLRHLEILYEIGRSSNMSNISRLVNLETLSITLDDMKLLPSITGLRSLQKLQLKDCFSLEKLPPNLDALVALCSLDVSGTRIKSLPESITKLQNLEHLILPKCFRRDRWPEVAIVDSTGKTYYKRLGSTNVSVDNTEETYYEHMGYYNNRYETSTETVVDETEQSVIPVAVETCNKRNDMVPVVGVAETVIAEQTPAHDDIGYTEQITSKQGVDSHVHRDSLLNGRNELIYQNSQNVTCSSQWLDEFLLISDETRIEGNDIELDSTELENEAFSQKSKASIIDVPPHQQHDTQIHGDLSYNVREDSNPGGEGIVSMQIDQNDTMIMESEQGIAPCETQNHDYGGNIQQMNIILEKLKPYLSGKLQEQEVIDRLQGNGSEQISKEKKQKLRRFLLEVLPYLTTNMTLEAVAKKFQLSESEFKRRKNYWGIKWPSSREKQQLTPKKRKNNLEAPFQSDSSLHNSASPINPAPKNNEHIQEQASSSYTTIEPPRETLKETQHIQEHLDGADECTSPNSLQRNKSSSSFTVKATYKEDTIKFDFSLSKSIYQLRKEVGSRLELQVGTFKLKYLDKDEEWILITRIADLKDPINLSRSSGSNTVRLLIVSKT